MKQIITVTLLLVITLSSTITAQHISSESYNTEFIHEDFNSEGEHFKTVTTTDNYFILDKFAKYEEENHFCISKVIYIHQNREKDSI